MSFEAAGFYAYDLAGALKWKIDLGNIAKGGLGPGTSPLICRNLVILQCDQEMGEGLVHRRVRQGDGQGGVARDADDAAPGWATPIVVTSAGGRDELVTSGAEAVVAYDPKTGKELWTAPGVVSHPIPSFVTGERAGVGDGGQPGQDGAGAAAGPLGERRRARRVEVQQGRGVRHRRRSSTATTCIWSATPAS
ncbi:MAG: hypothetical protein MZU95_01160 [Desulfomicrobium escambiense]|nr:hypothetical protein [Desulfomicrobium escambiense]